MSPDNGLDAEDMVGPKCSCEPPRCGASNPSADLWERDGGKEASEAVLPPLINPASCYRLDFGRERRTCH